MEKTFFCNDTNYNITRMNLIQLMKNYEQKKVVSTDAHGLFLNFDINNISSVHNIGRILGY